MCSMYRKVVQNILSYSLSPSYILAGQSADKTIRQLDGGLRCIGFLLTTHLIGRCLLKVRCQSGQLLFQRLQNKSLRYSRIYY